MTPEEVKNLGADDYNKGIILTENPYRYTTMKTEGIFKSSLWEQGWLAEQERQMGSDGVMV
jgi:hypothetical protein